MDVTYENAIQAAANLFPDQDEWRFNPEYLRGMCEIIADIFPVAPRFAPEEDLESRTTKVLADIRLQVNGQ